MLNERARSVLNILRQALELKQVVVYWYDSANDQESQLFMNSICSEFRQLKANVTIEPHFVDKKTIYKRNNKVA